MKIQIKCFIQKIHAVPVILAIFAFAGMVTAGVVMCETKPVYASTSHEVKAAKLTKKKAVKVVHKYKANKGKRKVTLFGKSKDGKVVWKFSSPYCVCTELSDNEYFINKNVIYLFSNKLYAIDKTTGKVKWTYDYGVGSPCAAFDKKGNLYCAGYYTEGFICISPEGKLKFESNFAEPYQWPSKIKIVSGKVRVYILNSDNEKQYYLIYNQDGKYLGKKNAG